MHQAVIGARPVILACMMRQLTSVLHSWHPHSIPQDAPCKAVVQHAVNRPLGQ